MAEKYGIPLSTLLLWEKNANKVTASALAGVDASLFLEEGTAARAWEAYQADRAAEREREAREARIVELGNDCFFFELPEALVALCERARAESVSLHIVWDAEENKHILRVAHMKQATHKATGKGKGKGGGTPANVENAKYLYNGAPFVGSLKAHILSTYPDSKAANALRKAAEHGYGQSAWAAARSDKAISSYYSKR